ncbi:MAG: hypothetical protein R3A12_19050 [Ignavibacteria bacterium]
MKFDYTVVRHSTPGIPLLLQKFSGSKIINAGDGKNEHPTQGLLDIYTLKEIYGDIKGLNGSNSRGHFTQQGCAFQIFTD